MDTAETTTLSAPADTGVPGTRRPRTDSSQEVAPGEPGRVSVRQFVLSALVAAVLLGVFILWAASHPNGPRHTVEVDAVVKLAAALLAAASCLVFGRRAPSEMRLGWAWSAAFAIVWAVGQAIVTWYDFARHASLPFPSAADAAFLAALPIGAIAVLLFPSAPRLGVSRARMPLDGIVVAGSLLIVSWTTALGTVYHSGSGSVFSQAVGLAYPIGDVIVATVGVIALLRSRSRQRVPLALVVAGLICLSVADSSLADLSHLTWFRYDTLLDAGRVAGFLLIALAPMWPLERTTTTDDGVESESQSAWQVALPYLFLGIAIAAARNIATSTSSRCSSVRATISLDRPLGIALHSPIEGCKKRARLRGRCPHELLRRHQHLKVSRVHQPDARPQHQRLAHIVRHEDSGLAKCPAPRQKLLL